MKFSLRTIFVFTFVCVVLIWLFEIKMREIQRSKSLKRNSYIAISDADEALRKQIGNSIKGLGRRDDLTIANASIYIYDKDCSGLTIHCVAWRHPEISKAELSNGDSVTEVELTPIKLFDDGLLFAYSGTLQPDFATLKTSNFDEFRVRLLNNENQVFTEWFPVWVWHFSGDRKLILHPENRTKVSAAEQEKGVKQE